jgi:predicted DCC family thiol-disulfide oxidoreductase YuxK
MRSFEVFFDGDCPLCAREIRWLQRLDRRLNITFSNIAAPEFVSPYGVTHDELMAEIHGRHANGDMVKGVEVFRQLYTAVGFGPLVQLTRLPLVRQLLNFGYHLFAKNRLRLTGRCDKNGCVIPPRPV